MNDVLWGNALADLGEQRDRDLIWGLRNLDERMQTGVL